ncbi:MAG: S1 RNA-binding domain-containing protein [Planctomycetota bacterium]
MAESHSNPDQASNPPVSPPNGGSESERRRILIGSQRDPAAYRPRRRDWIPIEEENRAPTETPPGQLSAPQQPPDAGAVQLAPDAPGAPASQAAEELQPSESTSAASNAGASGEIVDAGQSEAVPSVSQASAGSVLASAPQDAGSPPQGSPPTSGPERGAADLGSLMRELDEPKKGPPVGKIPPPNLRDRLTPDLEAELEAALGDASIDDLLAEGPGGGAPAASLEPESRQQAKVISVRREDVFVELGGREQGSVPLRQFQAPPSPGDVVEVVVQRFNPEDGLYELSVPNAAVKVEDWGDLAAGMIVDAKITGHNTGGLEAEVNHIRAFVPMSQIALYRVENAEEFVGQTLTCVVTEANPDRRNLVLSRRAVLEREREEARTKAFDELAPGQIREGVVRKIMDFGAFVDLGGVDGLLHVSQLAWHRVNHPSEVVQEGQPIKVRIEKIDPDTRKISLSYREMLENPWTQAARKYPTSTVVRGRVAKIMEFGAFVELEPGVEGLVHVSELSHKRVWRVTDVVKEGEEVDVLVLSVDPEAQRMSLSMKALSKAPEKAKKEEPEEPEEEAAAVPAPKQNVPSKPLRGGLGRKTGGEQFGLKW